VLLIVDARDRGAADVAGLSQPVVDAIGPCVARAALSQLQAPGQLLVDRRGEALDLLVVELGRQRERRQLGMVEDLVRPRAPDAGQSALVA
jgi:hypothetical protein